MINMMAVDLIEQTRHNIQAADVTSLEDVQRAPPGGLQRRSAARPSRILQASSVTTSTTTTRCCA